MPTTSPSTQVIVALSTSTSAQASSPLETATNATQADTSTRTTDTAAGGIAGAPTDALPADSAESAALIGGIFGGLFALLLVGGLVAFALTRSRRRGIDEPNNSALWSVHMSNQGVHGAGVASNRSDYDSLPPPPQNYNPLPAVRDIYAKPRSPNCTEYEYGDLENVH